MTHVLPVPIAQTDIPRDRIAGPDRESAPADVATRSLADRLTDGHQSPAWDEFVRVYTPMLKSWLRPHLPQAADVDDVVQDILLVVVRRFPEFRPAVPGALRAWLRVILAYQRQSFWRQKGRTPAVAGETALNALADPSSEMGLRWDTAHDRHALGALLAKAHPHFSLLTREAFRRTALLGEAPAAVAASLGMTPNAVFIARSRVTQRLLREASETAGGRPT